MASAARAARRAAVRSAHAGAPAHPTKDSFQNLESRLGIGANNSISGSSYVLNPITRKRADLEWMYRGSWIVGAAVDAVADDMVRAGIDIDSVVPPEQIAATLSDFERMEIWQNLGNAIRWSRLYGGAGCILLVDGQDVSQPLRFDTIGKGQFKGLFALDRWMAIPQTGQVVEDLGPDLGKPVFYTVQADAPALRGKRIHYSRFLRFDGIDLPYWQRIAEQGWGMSVIERLYDRLVAFDSTTQGAAQLVYKAHLRTLKKKGLNQLLAGGGPAMEAFAKNVEAIRRFQTTEGMSVIDSEDEFETTSYTFSGLSDMMLQFGEQISGALQIPLVRLFGQSPAGMNATGESDLRTYYDGIAAQQESKLRGPLTRLLRVMHRSAFGADLPRDFNFTFNPLWQLSDTEKADIATKVATAVVGAMDAGIIERPTALKELRQSADVTGIFSNISDDDIEEAEAEPPMPMEADTAEGDNPLKMREPADEPDDEDADA